MRRILSIMTLLAFLSGQTISYASLPADVDTSKLPPNGGEHYNRLIFEKSPYLLLHAANPIDWFPWSEEAFEKARREGKPIFLSIGYSTCHWCHVMEDESFADAVVAEILNRAFVSIKVDREERPDIDQVYMTVSRMLTGGGGWPLTILMTPEKKPFFAGTYIPKEARFGRQGLLELLTRVEELWKGERKRVVDSAEGIAEALSRVGAPGTGRIPGREVLAAAYKSLEGSYDEKYGGFGRAPKFPRPHVFQFLLRYGLREEKSRAVEMTRVSLTSLRRGGMLDYVGKEPRFNSFNEFEEHIKEISSSYGHLTDAQWHHLAVHSACKFDNGTYGFNYDPGIAASLKKHVSQDINMWKQWDALNIPTLVLHGGKSNVLRPDTVAEMQVRGAMVKITELPNIGHAPMLISNDQIILVKDYLLAPEGTAGFF